MMRASLKRSSRRHFTYDLIEVEDPLFMADGVETKNIPFPMMMTISINVYPTIVFQSTMYAPDHIFKVEGTGKFLFE